MSWAEYLDGANGIIPKSRDNVTAAGIYGLNGAVWAQKDLTASYEDILRLAKLFEDDDEVKQALERGFEFTGNKYTYLRGDEQMIQAKGKCGQMAPLTVFKTKKALVVALGGESAVAGLVSTAVSQIGDYLVNYGY